MPEWIKEKWGADALRQWDAIYDSLIADGKSKQRAAEIATGTVRNRFGKGKSYDQSFVKANVLGLTEAVYDLMFEYMSELEDLSAKGDETFFIIDEKRMRAIEKALSKIPPQQGNVEYLLEEIDAVIDNAIYTLEDNKWHMFIDDMDEMSGTLLDIYLPQLRDIVESSNKSSDKAYRYDPQDVVRYHKDFIKLIEEGYELLDKAVNKLGNAVAFAQTLNHVGTFQYELDAINKAFSLAGQSQSTAKEIIAGQSNNAYLADTEMNLSLPEGALRSIPKHG